MGVRSTTETKMDSRSIKLEIIAAGRKAVKQLIKVAKEDIIKPDPDDELAADRLKNAAATKNAAVIIGVRLVVDSQADLTPARVRYNRRSKWRTACPASP